MRLRSFCFIVALLFHAGGELRAENTFSVTSAVTPLNFGGKTEVLGGITLSSTASAASVADSLEFLFPQLEITNGFEGQIAMDPATGIAAAPGGITLYASGGWRNAGVHISFQASFQGGKVQVALPPGLMVAAQDYVSLNGIRADIAHKAVGESIRARISSGNSTYNLTEPVVGLLKPALDLVVETGYVPGCSQANILPQVILREGFAASFVQHVPAPVNPRPLYGATGNTQIRLLASELPEGVGIQWPALVTGSLASLQLVSQDTVGSEAIYDFRTTDQAASDRVEESFTIQPSLHLETTVHTGIAYLRAQLYPPASSNAVPRFDFAPIPSAGAEFLAVGFSPEDDTHPPSVRISSPADGTPQSGLFTVTAAATDDAGVVGVQFFLDGTPLGAEDTTAPFSVTADAGPLSPGVHALMARARDHGGRTAASLPVSFKKTAPVTLSGLNPASGPVSGGTTVVLSGSGFQEGAILRIGGLESQQVFGASEHRAFLTPAAYHAGEVDVELINPDGGISRLFSAFRYTAISSVLEQMEPASKNAWDPSFILTIRGKNFSRGTRALWNHSPRVTRFISPERLEACIYPMDLSAPGSIAVQVETDGEKSPEILTFNVLSAASTPLLASILPASGTTTGNEKVSISGSGFAPSHLPALLETRSPFSLGNQPLGSLVFVDNTQIDGIAPALPAGPADLKAEFPGLPVQTLPGAYQAKDFLPLGSRASQTLLPVQRLWIPFVADNQQFRTNLGLNNPLGEEVQAIILLINRAGEVVAEKACRIPVHGLVQINNVLRFLEGTTERTGREGYLVVETNRAIAAWASLIDNLTNDPVVMQGAPAMEGSTRIILPSSVQSEQYHTELLLVNVTPVAGNLQVRLYDSAGTLQATLPSQSIPAHGQLRFEDLYKQARLSTGSGPVEVETSGGTLLLAGARIYTPQGTGAYLPGIPASRAGNVILLPYSTDTPDARTNLGISNPNPVPTGVTASLTNPEGQIVGSTNLMILPHGMTQLNNINRLLLNQSGMTNTTGSLVISSFFPVIGWTSVIDNKTQDFSFSVAGRPVNASKLLMPSATALGEFSSDLTLLNCGTKFAQVRVNAYDAGGTLSASRLVGAPAAGQFHVENILGYLGLSGFFGPLELISVEGQPIQASSRVQSRQNTGGSFAGQPIP